MSVYYLFLQYFDTDGWVFCPVKAISRVTYTVLAPWRGRKTLLNPVYPSNVNLSQSYGQNLAVSQPVFDDVIAHFEVRLSPI